MTRPSRNVDRLLLRAGRELFPETGVAQLSVRKVALRAGVNPGMFHYHFGNKDLFVRQLLQDLYDEMFASLELAASARSPRDALRAALNILGRFARDNTKLLRRLIADALSGDPLAREFLRANMPRHVSVLLGLIKSGQRDGVLRPMAPAHALAFLAGSVAAPILIGGTLANSGALTVRGRDNLLAGETVTNDEGASITIAFSGMLALSHTRIIDPWRNADIDLWVELV